MSIAKARSRAPLFYLQAMRIEDGPPLPVACDMCWTAQLQTIPIVPELHVCVLLALLGGHGDLALERSFK